MASVICKDHVLAHRNTYTKQNSPLLLFLTATFHFFKLNNYTFHFSVTKIGMYMYKSVHFLICQTLYHNPQITDVCHVKAMFLIRY